MPQFHETLIGKRFYQEQLPSLTFALERIANALDKILREYQEEQGKIETDSKIPEITPEPV